MINWWREQTATVSVVNKYRATDSGCQLVVFLSGLFFHGIIGYVLSGHRVCILGATNTGGLIVKWIAVSRMCYVCYTAGCVYKLPKCLLFRKGGVHDRFYGSHK